MKVGSDQIDLRVSSAETGGAVMAAEVTMPAGGGPPVLHRHAAEEIYRGEAGDFTIYCEDADGAVERIPLGRGDVVHIPSRRAHTVRNESDAEARAYVVYFPGEDMERFIRAAAGLSSPEPAAVMALAARHGIEFTAH